jgi:hypothetical protein
MDLGGEMWTNIGTKMGANTESKNKCVLEVTTPNSWWIWWSRGALNIKDYISMLYFLILFFY